MKAVEIATKAAELVGGERDRQHGDKTVNFENIATLWTAYLCARGLLYFDGPSGETATLEPLDVAQMMTLMKIARTMSGEHNPDDYIDGAGYQACAGEIAAAER